MKDIKYYLYIIAKKNIIIKNYIEKKLNRIRQ